MITVTILPVLAMWLLKERLLTAASEMVPVEIGHRLSLLLSVICIFVTLFVQLYVTSAQSWYPVLSDYFVSTLNYLGFSQSPNQRLDFCATQTNVLEEGIS